MLPDRKMLSSQVLLVQPSETEFDRVMATVMCAMPALMSTYDMDSLNRL